MNIFESYDYKKNKYLTEYWRGVKHGLWITIIGIILLTIGASFCFGAEGVDVDLDIIIDCESSGNAEAVSPAGAIGLCQIMPGKFGAMAEWNKFHSNEQYTKQDLFNPQVSMRIAYWMLHERIPAMIKAYKKPVTLENVLISYNAGIAYVKNDWNLPKETIDYIAKYKRKSAVKV